MIKKLMTIMACVMLATALCGNLCMAEEAFYLAKKNKHDKHQKKKKVKYVYHYYPASQVYFLPGENIYFFLEGKKWKKSPKLPKGLKKGKHVLIETDTHEPYIYVQEHKKKYKVQAVSGYTYHYYPDCYTYYYPAKKVYYFRERNAWKKVAKLPPGFLTGNHVLVNVESSEPYILFEEHKKKYKPKLQKLSISIPPDTYLRLKQLAAKRGTSIKAIVLESIENTMAGQP